LLELLVLRAPETALTPIVSANKVEGEEGEVWADALAHSPAVFGGRQKLCPPPLRGVAFVCGPSWIRKYE